MRAIRIAALTVLASFATANAFAAVSSADPLAAIDMNRNAIIADIVQGFDGDRAVLARRLAGLRADRLLSASLASTPATLESILIEAEKSSVAAIGRSGAKVLGSANADLVYTPITPCRLVDTRGFGAPIAGGPFAPNERRSYAPNGLCSLPLTGVASMLISFTTLNNTPGSGGYISIVGPAAPITTTVDIFNVGTSWSASSTAVATGSAAQFDVFVSTASPEVVIDILGYFAPPQGGFVSSITAGAGLTGGTITSTGTIDIAAGFQLPQSCTNGQVAQSNGAGAWTCVTPTPSGGTVTGVTASAPLASSGGTTPDISLAGIIDVANGGTGQPALTANGVLYGQGTAAVGTTVGVAGQVLVGNAGPPSWTGSPFLSGNLNLTDSTTSSGNILKGGNPFIHNSGFENTFVGIAAGNLATSGGINTGIGRNALESNTNGFGNTAVGSTALQFNNVGFYNTAVGARSLPNNTSGNNNTAVGSYALQYNTTGQFNIGIGYVAGAVHDTGDFNIHIGSSGEAADNKTIRIGTEGTHLRAFIGGIRSITTDVGDAVAVLIDSNGQLGTISSSRRFKDDIADMDASTSALMKLRPVTFHYKTDRSPSARMQYGLIAEEVEQVYPGLVAHSADGQVETVMYQYLPSMLLNEYQKQQHVIEAQTARLDAQAREIAELKKLMALALDRRAPFNIVRQ
jgi:Chaperone of endosialidase